MNAGNPFKSILRVANKGFTLIELVAVIVILGVLSLSTTQ
ncbi:MAG: prepilin-type N-terminal cleavage/methylation domain-containing protein, partial [Phenylobacterium sp.]